MLFGHHHKAKQWGKPWNNEKLDIPVIAAAAKTPDVKYFHVYEWDKNGELQIEKVKYR